MRTESGAAMPPPCLEYIGHEEPGEQKIHCAHQLEDQVAHQRDKRAVHELVPRLGWRRRRIGDHEEGEIQRGEVQVSARIDGEVAERPQLPLTGICVPTRPARLRTSLFASNREQQLSTARNHSSALSVAVSRRARSASVLGWPMTSSRTTVPMSAVVRTCASLSLTVPSSAPRRRRSSTRPSSAWHPRRSPLLRSALRAPAAGVKRCASTSIASGIA